MPNKQNPLPIPPLLFPILFLTNLITQTHTACLTESPTLGCLTCNPPQTLAYNLSSSRYACTAVVNCTQLRGDVCVECGYGAVIDQAGGGCVVAVGCVRYNGTCVECGDGYELGEGVCYLRNIQYCSKYAVVNATLQCTECLHNLIWTPPNCTPNLTLCLQFDYTLLKCQQCPQNTTMASNGQICYSPIPQCQVYDNGNRNGGNVGQCLLCKINYVFNGSLCVLGQVLGVQEQVLKINRTDFVSSYEYICIDINHVYNSTLGLCEVNPISILHCKQLDPANTSTCLTCQPGYYLSTPKCIQCSLTLSNCALCTTAQFCTACSYSYYLLTINSTATKCMPCSSYGCLHCSTQFNVDGKVECVSCPVNATLYEGTCFRCENASFAYSIREMNCLSCALRSPNCRFCKFNNNEADDITCIQCQNNFVLDNNTCQPIPTTALTKQNSIQYLKKLSPGLENPLYTSLYNNKNALMSICNQTDGYVCICANTSVNQTSLCTGFSELVAGVDLGAVVFAGEDIAMYSQQLRLASQFPGFTLTNFPAPTQQLTHHQFWHVLSTYTNILNRNQLLTDRPTAATTQILTRIGEHTRTMNSTFSDQKVTVLRGNGFYYKFVPVGVGNLGGVVGDDGYVYTTLSSTQYVGIFVWYLRNLRVGVITGTITVYTPNPSPFNLTIRKTRHFTNHQTLTPTISGLTDQTRNLTTQSGYITIPNFPLNTPVLVSSQESTQTTPEQALYNSQKIENIFYSQSWLYILFFIFLYLVFVPFCAIVDCCESEQYMRKKVGSSEGSQNKNSEGEVVIKVNYKDFFPMYNTGNTPRPRRLMKLCLFLLNMQHIVTFLTLIYFNLPANNPIGAIALVIPAYLCTVVMGYLIGFIFRSLPGTTKYLINILPPCYWILWFFLMRIMTQKASEYRLYILVFSIMCFFVDLVLDGLETLLVYFAISQEEKQVKLFQCLARWLSYRGFYEFDRLAEQIGRDGGNQ